MLANPAPLPDGLPAFNFTILLNPHNAGFSPSTVLYSGDGDFHGGIARYLFAGLLEYKKAIGFAFTLTVRSADAGRHPADAENGPDGMRLTPATRRLFRSRGRVHAVYVLRYAESRPRAAICFPEPDVLFALLAVGNITGNEAIIHIAAVIGLVLRRQRYLSGYASSAVHNLGRTISPIGEARI